MITEKFMDHIAKPNRTTEFLTVIYIVERPILIMSFLF